MKDKMHALLRTEGGDVADPAQRLELTSLIRVAEVLTESGMPPDEVHAVVTSAEPELIRRYFELHLERLEEWLARQRRNLDVVERMLADSA